jgi:diadenosine tetraphosphate (Ap4A) HIT family hydrolase
VDPEPLFEEEMFERYQPDLDAYVRRVRTGTCFVCGIVSRDPSFPDHHIVCEDEGAIVFLAMDPTQYGYTLVAPKEHREQVAGDFTVEEYLALQRVVHRAAEAVREEVGAERVYVLLLGSNQGNAHVHWQVVPLPPDTPYEEQQFAAIMLETAGALKIPDKEKEVLATRIGGRMERM